MDDKVTDVDLIRCFDAKIWAGEFCKRNKAVNEPTMLGWFANAIMAGYDYARRQAQEAPKAESQSAEDDFGPVNLNDEEPDKLKAARKARAWIDGILCQCDTTVDHVCDRCVLIRSIDKALSALDDGRKG